LFVWGDSDEEFADQQRAEVLGNRLEADGIDAKVFLLHRIWIDWLDVLTRLGEKRSLSVLDSLD